MKITKVIRSYSRSINTKSYGNPGESWVKLEASYESECESADDPVKVSEMLHAQAQADVSTGITDIINKIKAANPSTVPATMAPTVPVDSGPRTL